MAIWHSLWRKSPWYPIYSQYTIGFLVKSFFLLLKSTYFLLQWPKHPEASLGTPWTSGRCGATSRITVSSVTSVTPASPSTSRHRRRMPLCRARIVSRSMSSNQVRTECGWRHGDFMGICSCSCGFFYGIWLINNMKMDIDRPLVI